MLNRIFAVNQSIVEILIVISLSARRSRFQRKLINYQKDGVWLTRYELLYISSQRKRTCDIVLRIAKPMKHSDRPNRWRITEIEMVILIVKDEENSRNNVFG